ncbi:hypothetical protein [Streptomyces sp. NPDC053755]|uniref:SPW repeat domain-containing protein n=1 Tax=Streptomyces sp. NPDC053755 TaxID=3155815 RepID=UPI00341CD7A3
MSTYNHHYIAKDAVTRQGLRVAVHDQLLSLPMLLAAVALTILPMGWQDGPKDAQVNEVIVGVILLFVVGRRLYSGSSVRSDLIVGVLGAWMIVAPFLLGLQNTQVELGSKILDITAGSVLVLSAGASLLVLRGRRGDGGHGTRGQG